MRKWLSIAAAVIGVGLVSGVGYTFLHGAPEPVQDQPKVAVKIEYEENEKHAIQARILRHMGLLEAFAANAADRYAWPNPLTIEARSCGMANARWRRRVLTLCYELANEFIEVFLGYSSKLPRNRKRGKT